MKSTLILSEKPSVARDIAKVVGASRQAEGYLEGNGYQVTWAIGHLVTLPYPHEINPEWKSWKKETLPMLPEKWSLKVVEKTQSQFKVVKALLKECGSLICATDAGREGELIFRYIYEAAHCKKPFQRLWISSLTPDAIEQGLKNLKSGQSYDPLADAARARSCADWLIGMNLSRAYAITHDEQYFVGRVQTPTLAMIVKRDLEIANFKTEDYFEIHARFSLKELETSVYEGIYLGEKEELDQKPTTLAKRLPPDQKLVQNLAARIQSGLAKIKSFESKKEKQLPPLLYDLTELQRHANRLFGLSASRTLEIAQTLYEKYKLISYPRTDSKCLSHTVAKTLPQIVSAIRTPYEEHLNPSTGKTPLVNRFVNDSEVSDHHAIIPTGLLVSKFKLSLEEDRIYDLICRRILAAWQEDCITSVTTVLTHVSMSDGSESIFRSQGRVIDELGWKKLEIDFQEKTTNTDEKFLPADLKLNLEVQIKSVKPELKKTKAPPHLTEAALLTAMETAGRTLDDRELASVIKDSGLGTPATRAGMIETLLTRGYIERRAKSLISTQLGKQLIEIVHPSVKSPELTARWEKELSQIQKGHRTLTEFMKALELELTERVKEILSVPQVRKAFIAPSVQIDPKEETRISGQILKVLSQGGSKAAGKLFEDVSKGIKNLERRAFERVLQNLAGKGGVQVSQEKFEKDGKQINYRKVTFVLPHPS